MSIASEWAEEKCRKSLVERLVLGLTCRKYNLLYENEDTWKMWKFSFQEVGRKFQVYAIRRTWYNDVPYPPWSYKRNWRIRQITLSSPVGNIEQMHFWMAGVVNVFDYIKIEGIGYPVVAIT
jgi:hypothetical protein